MATLELEHWIGLGPKLDYDFCVHFILMFFFRKDRHSADQYKLKKILNSNIFKRLAYDLILEHIDLYKSAQHGENCCWREGRVYGVTSDSYNTWIPPTGQTVFRNYGFSYTI